MLLGGALVTVVWLALTLPLYYLFIFLVVMVILNFGQARRVWSHRNFTPPDRGGAETGGERRGFWSRLFGGGA
jgi:membrane protein implicated in regulation of membrane protease activity